MQGRRWGSRAAGPGEEEIWIKHFLAGSDGNVNGSVGKQVRGEDVLSL